jgi:hypothetical protein
MDHVKFSILVELQHLDINRVRGPTHDPAIPDQPSRHLIESCIEINRVTFGSAQRFWPFGEAEFLLEHVKQTLHRIVLAGVRPYYQTIASQAYDLSASNGYLESSGLDPVAGHFNDEPVRLGPVGLPVRFGLRQSVHGQWLKTRAPDQ